MSSTQEQFKQRKLMFQNPTTLNDLLNAFESNDIWLSRAQICGRVFRKTTPHLIAMIEELATCGELIKAIEPLPNGYQKFWYKKAVK